MAVKLVGVQNFQKYFPSDMTFNGIINLVLYKGRVPVPVFINTEYDTWNMDPVALKKTFELYTDLWDTRKINEIKAICDVHGAKSIEDANNVRKWFTQSRETASWYQYQGLCYNYRISNVIAGVVRAQLPYLEEHIAQKKAIYERYRKD